MFRFRTIQISESGAEDGQAAADSCFTEAGTIGGFFYHTFIGRPIGFYISLGILVFISVFAFSFWFMALQSKGAKVSDINMCRLINPILGAILSWMMLADEHPTFSTVTGMIIIVCSLIIYFKGTDIVRHFATKK